jgi:membrane protease YdiL (CAAX protease family)
MLDLSTEATSPPAKMQFFREIFFPALFAYLSFIGLAAVFGAIAGIVFGTQGEAATDAGKHAKALLGSFYGVQISSLLLYGALYIFVERRAIAAKRLSLRSLYVPVPRSSLVKCAGAGIGGAFLILVGIFLWSRLTATTLTPTPSEAGLMPGRHGISDSYKYLRIALSALTIGLVAPYVEEVFFRGLLQRWLAEKLPGGIAVLASALIFALFHFKMALHFNSWGVFLTLGIGGLGYATGYLYRKYGSLRPGFVLHASYNLTLLALSLLGRA